MASPALQPERAAALLARLESSVHRVIVGKERSVRLAITTLGAPGMAETDHLLGEDWSRRLAFDATGHL